MKKNLLMFVMSTCFAMSALTSCGKKIQIGILQPVEHDALTAAREGFIAGLEEKGFVVGKNIKIIYQNANGEPANQTAFAKSLTAKCDLTLGIGTGATQSLQAAHVNSGSTKPLLFTAVTDAVDVKLVASNENPGGFITGTSDVNPVTDQIDLIKTCLPDVDKIGIIYTQSEVNSKVQADLAKAQAEKDGITVVIETCTDSADVSSVANHLCATEGLDAIFIPTDNNIAAHMSAVSIPANEKHILLVGGEEGIVKNGAHITLSVNYTELGKKCGFMAAEVLNGKNPGELAVQSMSVNECNFVMSSANLAAANITLPADVLARFQDISAN